MNAHLERALILLQQARYDLAESEFKQAFSVAPDDPRVHGYYAICLCELEKFDEAKECASNAVRLGPDSPFSFYAAAYVAESTNEFKQGMQFITQAIEMSPYDEDLFALKSSLHMQLKQWQAALDTANEGLQLDPEHLTCLNLRAQSLVKLGRRSEAQGTIDLALERQPDSAMTHANRGWTLLEQSSPKEAMVHFREALRLEPNMEWARVGIVEAMKGQYFIYRMMLNWFLWCSKLSGQHLWMIILGGFFAYRFLSSVAANNPTARPYVIPLIVLYVAFVIMTCVSVPLFNLMLRFNRFGRMALSDQEKRTSTWVGLCILTASSLVVGYFVTDMSMFLRAALSVGLMLPALAFWHLSDEGWPKVVHTLILIYMLALAAIMLVGLVGWQFVLEPVNCVPMFMFNVSCTVLLLLGFVAQFAVNFLVSAKPSRTGKSTTWIWILGGLLAAMFWGLLALATHWIWTDAARELSYEDGVPPLRISLLKEEGLHSFAYDEELLPRFAELPKPLNKSKTQLVRRSIHADLPEDIIAVEAAFGLDGKTNSYRFPS